MPLTTTGAGSAWFSRSRRPFALGVVRSTSSRPFALLDAPARSTSRRPFALLGAIGSASVRPFALEGPAGSVSRRPFALDAADRPVSWGSYVGGAAYRYASLATAAPAGATEVSLTSVVGLRVGLPVLVGLGDARVAIAISGSTVTLDAPLTSAHAAGEPVRFDAPVPAPPAATVLSAPATAGATTVSLTDPSTVGPGTVLLVGGEVVVVASVAGAVATLASPLSSPWPAGAAVLPPGPYRAAFPVYDKGGILLGSLTDATVTAPPSREIGNGGTAQFYVPARGSSAGLVYDDRLVAMQTASGEPPWAGAMTVQQHTGGRLEVEVDDVLALLADGPKVTLKEDVPDATTAASLYRRAIALHNADAALVGEVQWEVDAQGDLPFHGDLDYDGDKLGLVRHIAERSGSEFTSEVRLDAGRLVPILVTRDKFVIPGGPLLRDGDDPASSISSVTVVRDPTPLVHELVLTGAPFDLSEVLPAWASWAGGTITPKVTARVDPGVHRLRATAEATVDWGLSKSAKAEAQKVVEDELYGMFFDYLKAIHDIEGRPFHEGFLWEGVTTYDESRESGREAMGRHRWRTRLQLVETFPDTPASAVAISDSHVDDPIFAWLIVNYNRSTGERSVNGWGFPTVAGASMTRWHIDDLASYTLYKASGGRIYSRTPITIAPGATEGTGGFIESYNTRLWDPFSKRYRSLRRFLSGANAHVGFLDPADPDITLQDLGPGAAIDLDTLSSLIGKVYDFELRNIDLWDPRRDGVGAYISKRSVFNGAITTRPRWHVVSFGGVDGASTSLVSGVSGADTEIEVQTDLGFPREDQVPFPGRLDDGPRTELVSVTAISGSLWTIVRGQNGTEAVPHEAGSSVSLVGGDDVVIPLPEASWPEGQAMADAMIARLSVPRTLLNLRIAMGRVPPSALRLGAVCPILVTTEGAAGGYDGDARIIAVSPDPLAGDAEIVVEYPFVP